MSLECARVIKADSLGMAESPSDVTTALAGGTSGAPAVPAPGFARRIPRLVAEGHEEAVRIIAEANAKANAIVAEARASGDAIAQQAAEEARAHEIAKLTAELLVLRITEEQKAEREIDRTIDLARLLAERLVGEMLAIEPSRIGGLAARALEETRGARRVRFEACRDDVPALEALLSELGGDVATIDVADLPRGSLVVHTEIGRVDARLAPQLARLAEALREVLRPPGNSGAKRGAKGGTKRE